MMMAGRLSTLVLLTATLTACAAKAQVRADVELPLLDPPPPPPRVVTTYKDEPAPVPVAPVAEAVPTRQPSRPQRTDAKPESTPAPEPVVEAVKPPAPSLTLSLSPGTEAQTAGAIRELMARASRDLARLNLAALNADGRGQADAARRFLQQAEDALKARNIIYAGKLADKAATIAAVLVR